MHEERELPLTPGDYKVMPGERWMVMSLKTNNVVYVGSARSNAPASRAPDHQP